MSTAGSPRRSRPLRSLSRDNRTKPVLEALERSGNPVNRVGLSANAVLKYQGWCRQAPTVNRRPIPRVFSHYGFLVAACHLDSRLLSSLKGMVSGLDDDECPLGTDDPGGAEHDYSWDCIKKSMRLWDHVVFGADHHDFFGPSHAVRIPKLRFDGLALRFEDLPGRFLNDAFIGDTGKRRTLTIVPTRQRVLAGAAAIVLQAYMQRRWHRGVVGYRPGVSCATTLSALREASLRTGWTTVVFGDIASFFDMIPHARLWQIVASELGIAVTDGVITYLRALLGTRSPDAPDYVEGVGIPQGNPLSPVLANMYAARVFDRVARRIGPVMRYADDFCLLVPDVAEGQDAIAALQEALRSANLDLKPEKCQIFDLSADFCVPATVPAQGAPSAALDPRAHCYLGVGMRWDRRSGDESPRIYYHLTDQKLWALTEGLRQTWIPGCVDVLAGASAIRMRREDAVTSAYRRSYNQIRGSLDYYGGLDWTPEQEGFFGAMLWIAGVTAYGPIPHIRAAMVANGVDFREAQIKAEEGFLPATVAALPWRFFRAEIFEGVQVPVVPEDQDWRCVDHDAYAAVLPEIARRMQPVVHAYRETFSKHFRSEIAARRDLRWGHPDTMGPGSMRSDYGAWSDRVAAAAAEPQDASAPRISPEGPAEAGTLEYGLGVVPEWFPEAFIGTRAGRNAARGFRGFPT